MSHNLKFKSDGSAVFASTQREWHGLGADTNGQAMTVEQALQATGMGDYTLVERPMYTGFGDVDTHKAVYLTGDGDPELVGVVGKDRKIFQPVEMLAPMDQLADASGGSIQSVGMLGNGAVWFATVLFPEGWTINGDQYQGYLFGRDSADGSSALDIRPTLVRVVCQNTFNCALSASKGMPRFTLRHTSNAQIDVAKVRQAIGMVPEYAAEFADAMNALVAQEFTRKQFLGMTDGMFGTPDPKAKTTRSQTVYDKRVAELVRLWGANTQDSTYRRGGPTKLTAFQAVGEYLDHLYGTDAKRIDRQIMGDTARFKTMALSMLLPA